MPIPRCAIVLGAYVMALCAAVSASADDDATAPHHIFYFDERRDLQLDLGAVAILMPEQHDARARAVGALAQRGVAEHALEPMPLARWTLARTPADIRAARAVEPLVADLAADPDVPFISPVFIDDLGGPLVVTPTLLVAFHDGVPPRRARAILEGAGVVLQENAWGAPGAYELRSPHRSGYAVLADANRLAQLPEVLYAEPDMLFTGRSSFIPNDAGFSACWGLHNVGQSGGAPDEDMDAPEAWDIETGDPSVIAVVIVAGVELDHPDLNAHPTGYDATGEDAGGYPNNPCDVHGTAVAGCISGAIDNFIGTVGVAPGCPVASARAFVSNQPCNGTWSANSTMTVASLNWADSIGARVTNNSNYYGFTSSAIAQKYAQLRNEGMVHFASAGNDFGSPITYPSSLPSVVSVAALGRQGTLASFSNFGTGLGVSAPGQDVYTTDNQGAGGYTSGDYAFVWGTSFASPYTAGVAALVISKVPTLSAVEVENLLFDNARDVGASGYDTIYGHGFVNAFASLLAAAPPPAPQPFTLLLPADGAVDVDESGAITFTWEESTNATNYRFTLATDPGLTQLAVPQTLRSTESYTLFPGVLDDETTYYWSVEAINAIDIVPSTPAVASFTTGAPPPPCPGDVTGDGDVTLEDFGVLGAHFGGGPGLTRAEGDLTNDGFVDLADFGQLGANFGASCF